ncbi:hypothetical protein HOY80DRAFT_1024991 [Tuber brumale]|nr:hypothetical protein HOY80DRAFT_1024991 [Tuber brumale]
MPPSPQQPRRQLTIALFKRRGRLVTCFLDLLERKKKRNAALDEVQQDAGITEVTRNKRIEALNAKIQAMEVKMSAYRDEIEQINLILEERGYTVQSFDSVARVMAWL